MAKPSPGGRKPLTFAAAKDEIAIYAAEAAPDHVLALPLSGQLAREPSGLEIPELDFLLIVMPAPIRRNPGSRKT